MQNILRGKAARGVTVSGRLSNMTMGLATRSRSTGGLSLSRPRWENLILAASLVVFWAGVIMKIVG
jgi:hypothetical protein